MKKVLLILVVLWTITTFAQERDSDKDRYLSLSYGVDARNLVLGSKPTGFKSAVDYTLEAHIIEEDFNFSLGFERFTEIEFTRLFMGLGYNYYVGDVWGTDIKFSLQPSLEWSNIKRTYNYSNAEYGVHNMSLTKSWSTPSLNLNFNWDLNKNIALQLYSNLLPRPDIKEIYHENSTKYILSNGVKGVFKFGHH